MKSEAGKMLMKTLLPVAIGLAVTGWLFRDDFDPARFAGFRWTWRMVAGFALAWVFMFGRDFGLSWRFHTIARPTLSWKRAFRVNYMCAFTSAVTPSAVGGSAFAIFYINREGVKLGRATTLTLTTLFLDEMFFVVFCPIIMACFPIDALFASTASDATFMGGVQLVFWLVYAGIVCWAAILFMGIIAKPHAVARLIKRVAMWRWLRRLRRSAFDTANNMVLASRELRSCSRGWWLNVFGATVVSWFSRYLVVNALFWGFIPGSDQLLIFARQFIVWVVLMVSPTPGGSGISEWLFTNYYGDLINSMSMALILALTWRIVSYYVYLAIGICLIPSYFSKRKK